jgi:hypothetical protein
MSFKNFKQRVYNTVEINSTSNNNDDNLPETFEEKVVEPELLEPTEELLKVETLPTKLISEFIVEDHMAEIEQMTKMQFFNYAQKDHEIDLDLRRTKENMINEFIQKLKEKN